jgi:hypothetical protein
MRIYRTLNEDEKKQKIPEIYKSVGSLTNVKHIKEKEIHKLKLDQYK